MEEKRLFWELPGRGDLFHSAILTSFSFNFHHFEFQVLRSLKQKWISSVVVMVDQRMLEDVLGLASGHIKLLSQSYAVVGMKASGAFHPKINFFVGDDKLLMIFGSGNITPGGHGKNHELFTGFYADNENSNQLPLLVESWNYLKYISSDIEGYIQNRLRQVIPDNCKFLTAELRSKHVFYNLDNTIEVALLYNDESSIFEQLISLIPNNDIYKITIICPYYDEDGETLNNLLEHFKKATLDVYLPLKFGLPPLKMGKNKRVKFYKWEETERGEMIISGKNSYYRKLHSKVIHFQAEDIEYCLLGSANATVHALGSPIKKPANQEFSALYKTLKMGFLKSIGVSGFKIRASLNDYSRESKITGDKTHSISRSVHIKSVDLNGKTLKVFLKAKNKSIKSNLCLFDGNGENIHRELIGNLETCLTVRISDKCILKNPAYVVIEDENGLSVSNKQLINYLDKLINTDPTKGNRSIVRIINSIEGGRINEFEIIELINQIQISVVKDKINSASGGSSNSSNTDNEAVTAAEMTYEEAVLASKNKIHHENIIKTYSSTRLWDTLSHLFDEIKDSIDDELMDEEEDANPVNSRNRDVADSDKPIIIIKNENYAKKIISSSENMVSNYLKSLKKVGRDQSLSVDIIDLSQFLLVTHVLTVVCCFTEFEIPNDNVPEEWQNSLNEKYKEYMLDILICFSRFCIQKSIRKYPEDEFHRDKLDNNIQKTIYHAYLYLYLLDRRFGEPVNTDKLELIGLNLMAYLGNADNNFRNYINDMSKTYQDVYFNPENVFKLYDKLKTIYKEPDKNKFITLTHSGFCKIIAAKSRSIEYMSLYGKNIISVAKYKKYKIDFNQYI